MDVAAYCLDKPGVTEEYPFGPEVTAFKVGGKMFALASPPERPERLSLKCDPVRAQLLRQDFPEITPGYHLNKQHWNTLDVTGALPEELVQELIDHSYDLVKGKRRPKQ